MDYSDGRCGVITAREAAAQSLAHGQAAAAKKAETHTMIANGNPKTLLAETKIPAVHNFLTRGGHE